MIIRMALDLPAEAAYVRLVRTMAETLLTDMGVVREDVDDIELIVGEVCANAVRHAYDNPNDRYEVRLDFSKDQFVITVRDHGKGADPERFRLDPTELREGGRGILLVQALSDRFNCLVDNGTTVHAAVQLHYESEDHAARAAERDSDDAKVSINAHST